MNIDQARDYILRHRSYLWRSQADQLIEWSNQTEFTIEQVEYLVRMPLWVYKCKSCGDPILFTYSSYVREWMDTHSGSEPRNSSAHTQYTEKRVILCDLCNARANNFMEGIGNL